MRSARSWGVGLLLSLTLPVAAVAQDAAAWRDSVQRVERELHALGDSLFQRDSTVADVAQRGDLTIAASAADRDAARQALEQFGKMRDRWFGTAMPASGGFRIVVRTDHRGPGLRFSIASDVGSVVLVGLPDTGNSVRSSADAVPAYLANLLSDRYSQMMFAGMPPAVFRWLTYPPSLSQSEKTRRDAAMYTLVTGTGHVQRQCVAGDVAACAYALVLRPSSAADAGGPFATSLRVDLFLTALGIGGPAGWLRLQHVTGPDVESALAAAAGIPVDSLLSRWRLGLLVLRPPANPIETRDASVAVAWIVVLLLGALGASRWA